MQKNKKIGKILLFVILFLILAVVSLPSLLSNINFGLDLQGGFEVLYQIDSINGEKLTNDMLTNTYKSILKRIDILGVTEPEISIEGDDKIRVQLAGVKDIEEARTILSKAANLTFRDTSDNLLMTSDVLSSGGASIGSSEAGAPAVALSIKDKETFYKVTKSISQKDDNRIVIWLDFDEGKDSFKAEEASCGNSDSRCLSVASVSQGFASDVIIQGRFTTEEVSTLVELINSGSLPTKLTEISSKTVDASFGSDSLSKTFVAGLVGIILIIIYMIFKYHFAGFIASFGIVIYTFLTFALFWLVGGVLTLPGIAAVLLGIGMAVDANVINFARIKDEYKIRKNFQTAYKKGNTNSIGTIIDSNVTTLIAAFILFIFGESSVKGFATMLIISTLVTLLVMVFLVRKVLNKFVETGYFDEKVNLFLGINEKNLKKEELVTKFNYVKNKSKFFTVTSLMIILGIISLIVVGLNLSIDFKGGSSITVKSEDKISVADIENDIEALEYEKVSSDSIDETTATITIEENLDQNEVLKVEEYLNEKYNASTDIGVVSNVVKKELIKNAFLSLLLAIIGIIIYVSIRFKFSYAISGIIALLHDSFLVISLFSLLHFEVSTIFIAAILSIVGYSINNTIVIFDRIKENLNKETIKSKDDLEKVVNLSIGQTMNRAIITTITTLIPVVCLIFLGSYEILNFNLALLIGLLAGTYSSMILAPNIFILLESKQIGKKPKKKWYEIDEVEEKNIKGINK